MENQSTKKRSRKLRLNPNTSDDDDEYADLKNKESIDIKKEEQLSKSNPNPSYDQRIDEKKKPNKQLKDQPLVKKLNPNPNEKKPNREMKDQSVIEKRLKAKANTSYDEGDGGLEKKPEDQASFKKGLTSKLNTSYHKDVGLKPNKEVKDHIVIGKRLKAEGNSSYDEKSDEDDNGLGKRKVNKERRLSSIGGQNKGKDPSYNQQSDNDNDDGLEKKPKKERREASISGQRRINEAMKSEEQALIRKRSVSNLNPKYHERSDNDQKKPNKQNKSKELVEDDEGGSRNGQRNKQRKVGDTGGERKSKQRRKGGDCVDVDDEKHLAITKAADARRKYWGPDGKGLMCHQCMRSDKSVVIYCSGKNCSRRYCSQCIERWYPLLSEKDVEEKCPYCRGNCNCRDCLRLKIVPKRKPYDGNPNTCDERIARLEYLVHFLYPVLKNIHQEQSIEKDIQAKIQGVDPSELTIERSDCGDDERVYCDNCRTSIFDYHRSCSKCSHDFCLTCCRKLGEDCVQKGTKIPCAKELRGCGEAELELKTMFPTNWVAQLLKNVQDLVDRDPLVNALTISQNQCRCYQKNGQVDGVCQNLRKAASREDSDDNYLYCPSSNDIQQRDLAHFQKHWVRGEPVIVRNVIDFETGLSWEPMVMWRAFREVSFKNASTLQVTAVDCLDWLEAIWQYADGYLSKKHLPEYSASMGLCWHVKLDNNYINFGAAAEGK